MSLLKPLAAICEVCGAELPREELLIAFGNHRFCRTCYTRVKPALKKAAYRSVRRKPSFDGTALGAFFILMVVLSTFFLSVIAILLTSGCVSTGVSDWMDVRSLCFDNGFNQVVNYGNSTNPLFYCRKTSAGSPTIERRVAFLKNGSATFALS